MPLTKGFTDELKSLLDHAAIGSAKDDLLSAIMSKIDLNFNSPLRLHATHPTADSKLNIDPNQVEMGTGIKQSTPPIDDTIQSYLATTIDFQTGAVTGGSVTLKGAAFALPSTTIGEFRRMVLAYNSTDNTVDCAFSDPVASVGLLPDPGTLFAQINGTPLGYLDLEANGATQFKTAASTTNIIENKVGSDSRIFNFNGFGSGGGGGGGSAIQWYPPAGLAALGAEEFGQPVYKFPQGGDNQLNSSIKVPDSYSPGSQLLLKVAYYTPGVSNSLQLVSTAYLIRNGTDAVNSTTNSHVSTNSANAGDALANKYFEVDLDLTDALGKINGVVVNPGDIINVELNRGSDAESEDIRVIPSATELKI